MGTRMGQPLWLPRLLIVPLLIMFCLLVATESHPDDGTILMALKEEWGPKNHMLSSWQGDDPCDSQQPWVGVQCDKKSRVKSLVLSNINLVGILTPDIGNLRSLTKLDLSYNANLTGTLCPELGSLANLQKLNLQYCGLYGRIPSELGNLSKLIFLGLNGNYLSGNIPHEIGMLTKLHWLDLSSNQLTGELPISATSGFGLDNLTKAAHFHLNNNSLVGAIPGAIFHSGMKLIHLLLDANKLEGPIPVELGLLPKIDIIKLSNNNLWGKIPDTISNLTTLSILEVDNNSLSHMPQDLSTLQYLIVLDLSDNDFNALNVPSWFSEFSSLKSLVMSHANVHGKLPSEVLALPQLEMLDMSNNFLNGTLDFPSNIGKELKYINLNYNNITHINDLTSCNKMNEMELQGNPVCNYDSSTPIYYCPMNLDNLPLNSSPPPSSNGCVTTSCSPPHLILNPNQCSCSIPFVGLFIFRAPQFKVIEYNINAFYNLTYAIANSIHIDVNQVVMANAFFDYLHYLNVRYHIFPPVSSQHHRWTQEQVYDLSSKLSDVDDGPKYPAVFGPPLFMPFLYPFSEKENSILSLGVKIGIIATTTILVTIIIVLCFYALHKRRQNVVELQSMPFASWRAKSMGVAGAPPNLKGGKYFSLSELKKATNNFNTNNEIGIGGFGKVYKGFLVSGEQVAIKRTHELFIQGAVEFKNEIELLSRVHHKNLVRLIGFCFEHGEKILVYEYMANGSLRENLSGQAGINMEWERRLMVALGAARGISYLHEFANPPIIHRDVKSDNILLDEENIAKVADFGISIVMLEGGEKAHVSTQVKGTTGYMDPEYYMTQRLTEKSDVYSFGVVLLEILTGRPAFEHGKYLVHEVKKYVDSDGNYSLLDPNLKDFPPALSDFNMLLNLALHCIQDTAEGRPSMNEVVNELESLVGMYKHLGSEAEYQQVKHPYNSYSDFEVIEREAIDNSFQYSSGFTVPTTVEPK